MKMCAMKAFKYATRHLTPGEVFEVKSRKDSRILRAMNRAAEYVEIEDSPMVAPEPEPEKVEDLAAVRAEYEATVGRRPFMGWDADTLRQKIADHRADAQS